MNEQKPTRAPYRSALRARQAAATRSAILDAATALFVAHGYAATSIDAIAEAAGVGRSTVFTATGGKPWLLKTAYDRAVVGDDEPVPLAERPEGRRLETMTDAAEIVAAYVAIIAAAASRVSSIYQVLRVAADSDAEVCALLREIDQERLTGARRIVGILAAASGLADRLDTDQAADIVTVYNDPSLHHHLVRTRGWSQEAFHTWLARALHHELLT
jgi:AcrR family transcriptional regulator